jgi:hypothetical protein
MTSLPAWAKRRATVRLLRVVAVLTPVLAACTAPLRVDPAGPGVPRVTEVRFDRDRVVRGCPVTMTVAFEDTDRDVVRVTVHSRHEKGKTSLQSFPVSVAEPPAASATGWRDNKSLHLRPEELGRHWYLVQVEDAGGRRSNVVREILLVDGPLPWRPQRCD